MKRRTFIYQTTIASSALLTGCQNTSSSEEPQKPDIVIPPLKISLAQWSIHRQLEAGTLDALDFAKISKTQFDIDAIELVNGFYKDHATDETFWQQMNQRSLDQGVENLLIMVDDEGHLGNPDDAARNLAVTNHHKWVHAAKLMGCHSIRVNAFGTGDEASVKAALVDGMGQLAAYAAQENINVLIENHGLYSSNAALIVSIIKEVGLPNLGTLPDFGNWCMSAEWGSTKGECENVYDIYQGVSEYLPYAKGVSAKSYDFDANGEVPQIDYTKMLALVVESGYDGYIGIEYEGDVLGENEGILATKTLLERSWEKVSASKR